ncbi:sua5/YciO/YrdC/YwlC family protein [Prevotella sp. CAG:891]|jgi:tRNA threonylcarbamoyl adenosine modification protein (Sua5/YciO/YrdC/YwlC family)|nr:L-threonylcarbamoyladenylate synthase [Prevotellamassilia sp.]CDE87593.1 sua5/YciO/YrdC/YwlC family protein [Prevotella sp. CAG:891]
MIKLYSKDNPIERIQKVVDVLNSGGVIIYPTGMTYALGCHALKERAVERICKIKQVNPAAHNLSVVCYDMSSISEYAHISTPIYKLMKRNLPGAFTFILPGKNKLPKIFRKRKSNEIGIQMPDNPILRDILEVLNAPLMTASLPISVDQDLNELIDPELVNEKYESVVDLVIDGGVGQEGASTVVDCLGEDYQIIRQGKGVLI